MPTVSYGWGANRRTWEDDHPMLASQVVMEVATRLNSDARMPLVCQSCAVHADAALADVVRLSLDPTDTIIWRRTLTGLLVQRLHGTADLVTDAEEDGPSMETLREQDAERRWEMHHDDL